MIISSKAFHWGDPIPAEYTCDGANVPPPLVFSEIPPGIASLALLMEDPDAPGGTFVHWLIWNMEYDAFAHADPISDTRAIKGVNSFGTMKYGGPCPPPGKPHRYYFRLYALGTMLDLPEGARKQDFQAALTDHVLEKAELMGTYGRG